MPLQQFSSYVLHYTVLDKSWLWNWSVSVAVHTYVSLALEEARKDGVKDRRH